MTAGWRQVALNFSGAIMVVATVSMVWYMCWGLMNKEIALNNKDAVMLALGVLLAKFSDIIGYFFGSSQHQKTQSETIDKLASTAQTAQAALTPAANAIPVASGESITVVGTDDTKAD